MAVVKNESFGQFEVVLFNELIRLIFIPFRPQPGYYHYELKVAIGRHIPLLLSIEITGETFGYITFTDDQMKQVLRGRSVTEERNRLFSYLVSLLYGQADVHEKLFRDLYGFSRIFSMSDSMKEMEQQWVQVLSSYFNEVRRAFEKETKEYTLYFHNWDDRNVASREIIDMSVRFDFRDRDLKGENFPNTFFFEVHLNADCPPFPGVIQVWVSRKGGAPALSDDNVTQFKLSYDVVLSLGQERVEDLLMRIIYGKKEEVGLNTEIQRLWETYLRKGLEEFFLGSLQSVPSIEFSEIDAVPLIHLKSPSSSDYSNYVSQYATVLSSRQPIPKEVVDHALKTCRDNDKGFLYFFLLFLTDPVRGCTIYDVDLYKALLELLGK